MENLWKTEPFAVSFQRGDGCTAGCNSSRIDLKPSNKCVDDKQTITLSSSFCSHIWSYIIHIYDFEWFQTDNWTERFYWVFCQVLCPLAAITRPYIAPDVDSYSWPVVGTVNSSECHFGSVMSSTRLVMVVLYDPYDLVVALRPRNILLFSVVVKQLKCPFSFLFHLFKAELYCHYLDSLSFAFRQICVE